jgi:antitoxin (DNA-binding transcriptional repressor) of toxin-antitoxin stability system
MKTVTASDTITLFSPILRAVSRGEAVMIVSRGTTVEQIIPARPAGGLESALTA